MRACVEKVGVLGWNKSQDTLNMIRTSSSHPQLSDYHILEGPHDFNRVPVAPLVCRATIINPPETWTSWGPRALDGTKSQPMNTIGHINSTSHPHEGSKHPHKLRFTHKMKNETPMDEASQIATTLTRAIQKIRKENQTSQGRHGYALQHLATIFGTTTENIVPTMIDTN